MDKAFFPGQLPGNDSPAAVDPDFHFMAYPDHVLVMMLDANGQCDFVSPSWAHFTGRDGSCEMGTGWLDGVHPDDRQILLNGQTGARQDQQPARLLYRYLRRDGLYRWILSQGMPRTDGTGKYAGHICLCFDVTAYQEGEEAAERSAHGMISLLRQTRLVAVVLDTRGRVQFSNGGLCRLLKCGGIELMDCRLFEHHLASSNHCLLEELYPGGFQSPHFPAEFESEMRTRDNENRFVSWHSMTLRDFSGEITNTILIGDDVTELRREEQQLSLTARIFKATHHAMLITDLEGTIIAVNGAFTLLTGYEECEAVGENPRILQSGRHDPEFYQQLWKKLLATGHWHGDVWDRRKDGSVYPKYLSISVIRNERGEATNYAGIFYDISERKSFEERLDHLAHYDALTGVPNRSLLLDRLEQAAERAERQKTRVGLLYLDLDHFKQINDTLGHSAGDALLKMVAQRMSATVRAVDTVARLGGDEFVVLIPDMDQSDDLTLVAKKLIGALTPAYEIEGRSVWTTPSIGISTYPDDCRDIHDLLRRADTAMYQVKQAGRGHFRFFRDGSS